MIASQESSDAIVVPELAFGCSIAVFIEMAAQSTSSGFDSFRRRLMGHRWQIPQSLLVPVSAGKPFL